MRRFSNIRPVFSSVFESQHNVPDILITVYTGLIIFHPTGVPHI